MGSGVSSIGQSAFDGCTKLGNITIPEGVTSLETGVFEFCTSLTSLFFQGNVPVFNGAVFGDNASDLTMYYLPGATGWTNNTFIGVPTVLWNPLIQTGDGGFGAQNDQFRFNITGATNIPIVVEACANLAGPVWTPLTNVNLTNGLFHFSDPMQTNGYGRYYRIRSP
jgi:hypothetical protein